MTFEWLNRFLHTQEKSADYAEKTLASYRLGMRAKGSILGVRIEIDSQGCEACRGIDSAELFHPDNAPHLPLPDCSKGDFCQCVYRPVMSYERGGSAENE